jgi:hypothetical protein
LNLVASFNFHFSGQNEENLGSNIMKVMMLLLKPIYRVISKADSKEAKVFFFRSIQETTGRCQKTIEVYDLE